ADGDDGFGTEREVQIEVPVAGQHDLVFDTLFGDLLDAADQVDPESAKEQEFSTLTRLNEEFGSVQTDSWADDSGSMIRDRTKEFGEDLISDEMEDSDDEDEDESKEPGKHES